MFLKITNRSYTRQQIFPVKGEALFVEERKSIKIDASVFTPFELERLEKFFLIEPVKETLPKVGKEKKPNSEESK